MAVTLRGVPHRERIEVTGDVQTTLRIPMTEDATYYLAFSDGTLVAGYYDEDRVYRFFPQIDGAGIVSIRSEDGHDVIRLDWKIEWVTISEECVRPEVEEERTLPLPGLLDDLRERLRETTH